MLVFAAVSLYAEDCLDTPRTKFVLIFRFSWEANLVFAPFGEFFLLRMGLLTSFGWVALRELNLPAARERMLTGSGWSSSYGLVRHARADGRG